MAFPWPENRRDRLAAELQSRVATGRGNASVLRPAVHQLSDAVRRLLRASRKYPTLISEKGQALTRLGQRLAPLVFDLTDDAYAGRLYDMVQEIEKLLGTRRVALTGAKEPTVQVVQRPSLASRTLQLLKNFIVVANIAAFVIIGLFKVAATSKRITGGLARRDPVTMSLFFGSVTTMSSISPSLVLWMTDYAPFVSASTLVKYVPVDLSPEYQGLATIGLNIALLVTLQTISSKALDVIKNKVQSGAMRVSGRLWRAIKGSKASVAPDAPLLARQEAEQATQVLAKNIENASDAWNRADEAADAAVSHQAANPRLAGEKLAESIRSEALVDARFDEFVDLIASKVATKVAAILDERNDRVGQQAAKDMDTALQQVEALLDEALGQVVEPTAPPTVRAMFLMASQNQQETWKLGLALQ